MTRAKYKRLSFYAVSCLLTYLCFCHSDQVTIWNSSFSEMTKVILWPGQKKQSYHLLFPKLHRLFYNRRSFYDRGILRPVGILKEVPSLWLGQNIKGCLFTMCLACWHLCFLSFWPGQKIQSYDSLFTKQSKVVLWPKVIFWPGHFKTCRNL